MELLLLLLVYGANPYLAIKTAEQQLKARFGEKEEFFITSGFSKLGLSDEESQVYIDKVNALIEDFFLDKLITELTTATQIAIQEPALSEGKEAISEKKEGKSKLKSSPDSYKKASTLDKYIAYKQDASTDTSLTEEAREKHTFDSLILEWIKTKSPKYLDAINELLGKTSTDQYNYYLKCLIEMNPSNGDASEILASTPSLLNKFCTLKKKLYDKATSSKEAESGTLELQDGVYEMEGGFKNKIFLKIAPELLNKLSAKVGYVEKVMKQLSDPKFIKANSMGISGIKDYPGQNISKLKIANKDSNLVSLTRYLDESGNLVIEFDDFLTHKEIDRFIKSGKKGQCIKCEDIESMVYEEAAEEELASPAAASATSESYYDPTVAVLGSDELPHDLE